MNNYHDTHLSDECPCGQWGGCADAGGCEGCCHLPSAPDRYRWIVDVEHLLNEDGICDRHTFHFDLVESRTNHPRGYAAIALDLYGWPAVRERAQRLIDDEAARAAS